MRESVLSDFIIIRKASGLGLRLLRVARDQFVLVLALSALAFGARSRCEPRFEQHVLLALEVVLQLGLLEQRPESLPDRTQLLLLPVCCVCA